MTEKIREKNPKNRAKNAEKTARENPRKSKEKSIARRTLFYFWQELRKHKIAIIFLIILGSGGVIGGNYISNLFISGIINNLTANLSATFSDVWVLVIFAILASAAAQICWRVAVVILWKLEMRVNYALDQFCFSRLATQSMSFHNNKFAGSLVSQTNKFVSASERLLDSFIFNLWPMIVSFVAIGIILFPRLPVFTAILLFIGILYLLFAYFSFKGIRELNEKEASAQSKRSGQLSDSMGNIFAVKSFGREKYEAARYNDFNKKVIKISTKLMRATTWRDAGFSVFIVAMIGASVVVMAGGREWFGAQIGTLVLAATYTINLINNIWNFNSVLRQINRSFGDAYEMTKILDEEISVRDLPNSRDLQVSHGAVEFKNVNFHHDDASENDEVFHNFNLKIPAGERIGLVGHSGSGKTTLTKLLLRFADVQKGEILIDAQNIAQITQNSLRKNIAYVPQEPLLFHRTIAENISYGKPDATLAEIREAARLANALDFIEKLPEKFETLTGERGVKLSGGQRQRIAIARAILKNAPILILDEATSALDTESEKLIQDALKNLMQNRTSIVIAHRLSTVANLDRIVVLEDGKIVEDGKHSALLTEKNGIYARLWNRQTGAMKD